MGMTMNEGAGVAVTAGKYAGQVGVVDTTPRGEWADVLLVGQSWPVRVQVAHLATR